MNIVNRLTLRCLKQNKRRTAVTIIGIALSVTMLTALSTILFSFMDLMQREIIATEGEWHASLSGVSADQITKLEQGNGVSAVLLTREVGFARFPESTNPGKPYYYIREYNAPAFSHLGVQLLEGRLPAKAGEAVLSRDALDAFPDGAVRKIGDTFTLTTGYRAALEQEKGAAEKTEGRRLGRDDYFVQDGREQFHPQGERTYTLTGIIAPHYRDEMEQTYGPAYHLIGYCDAALFAAQGEPADPLLVFAPLNRSIYNEVASLAQQTGAQDYSFHRSLLQMYGMSSRGSVQTTLYLFVGVLLLIVLVGSSALIYNAFSISVAERSRYLGMLASVGATRRQKRRSVYFEGLVLGAIALPAGLLAGIGGIGVTFRLVGPMISEMVELSQEIRLIVSPLSVLAAVALSVLVIFVSVRKPALMASRTMPIDAIRQSRETALRGRDVRTARITKRLFGFEGEIALKNLKRNRRRYRTTVFSLTISVVLFLTVSFGVQLAVQAYGGETKAAPYDMMLHTSDRQVWEQLRGRVLQEDSITRYTIIDSLNTKAYLPREKVKDRFLEMAKLEEKNGHYLTPISILALDEQSFRRYLSEIGVEESCFDGQEYRAVLVNRQMWHSRNAQTDESIDQVIDLLNLKKGEAVALQDVDNEDHSSTLLGSLTITAVTSQNPFAVEEAQGVIFVVPERTGQAMRADFAQKFPQQERAYYQNAIPTVYLNTTDHRAVAELADSFNVAGFQDCVMILDNAVEREQAQNMITVVSVFAGGFIVLITLICVANMFNTISTSVALRRREFAMLKSVGMTPKGFRSMIRYESLFYAMKTLLYGLPVSLALMGVLQAILGRSFALPFRLPWVSLICAVAGVFAIVGLTMLYSSSKVKRNTIIDALKDENI